MVCEADSDKLFYENSYRKSHEVGDTLFTHAQNKQTIARIGRMLKSVGANVVAIVDIDVLDNTGNDDFIKLLEDMDCDAAKLATAKQILRDLRQEVGQETDGALFAKLTAAIKAAIEGETTYGRLKRRIKEALKRGSKWSTIKVDGLDALTTPEQKEKTNALLETAFENGILVVPVGELESWFPEIQASEKSKWFLQALPKLENEALPAKLGAFIANLATRLK